MTIFGWFDLSSVSNDTLSMEIQRGRPWEYYTNLRGEELVNTHTSFVNNVNSEDEIIFH